MTVKAQDIQWVKNEYLADRTIDEISIDTGKSVKTIKRYLAEAGVFSLSWHKTKEENSIAKVFHPVSNKTVPEVKAQQEASFHDAWLEKNKGQVYDKTTKTKPTTATKTTTSSLFA